jgi:hypothetical protein
MNALAKKLKALLMLVVFTANFYTVCHCTPIVAASPTPAAAHQPGCCMRHSFSAPAEKRPCNGKNDCCKTHSIKFNLLEKETAAAVTVHLAPVETFFAPNRSASFATMLFRESIQGPDLRQRYRYIPPPNLLTLHQRFLI